MLFEGFANMAGVACLEGNMLVEGFANMEGVEIHTSE